VQKQDTTEYTSRYVQYLASGYEIPASLLNRSRSVAVGTDGSEMPFPPTLPPVERLASQKIQLCWGKLCVSDNVCPFAALYQWMEHVLEQS